MKDIECLMNIIYQILVFDKYILQKQYFYGYFFTNYVKYLLEKRSNNIFNT